VIGTDAAAAPADVLGADGRWWRDAIVYQVYVRSFADGSGDGVGDLAGVRARLPYLAELGIDAIWFAPWYPSPMADAGYDVADYRAIEPLFGSLAEAEKLITEAHALGIRIIIDIVPNHGSDQQPWFAQALAAQPGSAERSRYHFRPGRGAGGELPPNDWTSMFGGPAWTQTPSAAPSAGPSAGHGADRAPGEWYLHLFTPGQPDFDWARPDVRAEFASVLRFWFDRGVDGFRIDSAGLLAKDPAARPATVIRMPVTFPPEPFSGGRMLSGLGVPDLSGRIGKPAYYTSDPFFAPREGNDFSVDIVRLESNGGRQVARIAGPPGRPLRAAGHPRRGRSRSWSRCR